jgi:membrane-associated protein
METIKAFIEEQLGVYGYPVIFAVVLLENAGIPLPGETAVLLGGYLSSPAGGGRLHVYWVILVATLAAVIGDNVGFWLGHRFARPRLQQGGRFLFLTPKTLQLAEGYFERFGVWTIFFARFIAGLRIVGALAAGTAGMHWPRFLVANAAGALAWATTMGLLGHFVGKGVEVFLAWVGRGGLIVLGCVIVLVGLTFLLRRLHKLSPGLWERMAHAQIWQGILVAFLEVVCIAVLVMVAEREVTRVDTAIAEWISEQKRPIIDALAYGGSLLGTLPVVTALTLGMVAQSWHRGRSWRERAALLWALLASEAVGLLLLNLIRLRDIKPATAMVWPFGFAGLVPLRAFAVFGMIASVIGHQYPSSRRIARGLAVYLILLTGFSVVWTKDQQLTEVFLEYAAAALILFAGIWWLEGYGPGLLLMPASPAPPATGPGLAATSAAPAAVPAASSTEAQR